MSKLSDFRAKRGGDLPLFLHKYFKNTVLSPTADQFRSQEFKREIQNYISSGTFTATKDGYVFVSGVGGGGGGAGTHEEPSQSKGGKGGATTIEVPSTGTKITFYGGDGGEFVDAPSGNRRGGVVTLSNTEFRVGDAAILNYFRFDDSFGFPDSSSGRPFPWGDGHGILSNVMSRRTSWSSGANGGGGGGATRPAITGTSSTSGGAGGASGAAGRDGIMSSSKWMQGGAGGGLGLYLPVFLNAGDRMVITIGAGGNAGNNRLSNDGNPGAGGKGVVVVETI